MKNLISLFLLFVIASCSSVDQPEPKLPIVATDYIGEWYLEDDSLVFNSGASYITPDYASYITISADSISGYYGMQGLKDAPVERRISFSNDTIKVYHNEDENNFDIELALIILPQSPNHFIYQLNDTSGLWLNKWRASTNVRRLK